MTKTDGDYILGTDPEELERLGAQHETWRQRSHDHWRRAGIGEGQTILDVGAGPGFAALDLAKVVGSSGRIIGIDRSPGFVAHLEREASRANAGNVEARLGELETLSLEPDSLDGAWARWVFAWLERPQVVLASIADALRPGATFAVLEYLDWASMCMVPHDAAFARAIEACMQSWPAGGAEIDVAVRLPALAEQAGLELVELQPVSRAGRYGSGEWTWITGFLTSYLPRLVERGLITEAERRAYEEVIEARKADGTYLVTPLVGELIFRKPAND